MKFVLQMIGGFAVKFLLRLLCIFPVQYNKLYFSSYNGTQYACSPKYLYEYLQKEYPDRYTYVWEYMNIQAAREIIPQSIIVKPKTLFSFYHVITSRIIVVNTDFSPYVPKRKNQIHIDTWHGGGAYKKVGLDIDRGRIFAFLQKIKTSRIDYYLSSSDAFTRVQSSAKAVPLQKFFCTGLPRNDIFFNKKGGSSQDAIQNKVKKTLSIPADAKILLYAPTFRGDHVLKDHHMQKKYPALDTQAALDACTQRWGGSWVCLIRSHYYVNHLSSAAFSSINTHIVIDASFYSDMQELLYSADVLITDYSSCMWDFSFTGRPTFIFAPDIVEYSQERDFYTPVNKWPHPLSQTNETLSCTILSFNKEKYDADIKKHIDDFRSYETGTACCSTAALIEQLTHT